jgi:hypothetical protein
MSLKSTTTLSKKPSDRKNQRFSLIIIEINLNILDSTGQTQITTMSKIKPTASKG